MRRRARRGGLPGRVGVEGASLDWMRALVMASTAACVPEPAAPPEIPLDDTDPPSELQLTVSPARPIPTRAPGVTPPVEPDHPLADLLPGAFEAVPLPVSLDSGRGQLPYDEVGPFRPTLTCMFQDGPRFIPTERSLDGEVPVLALVGGELVVQGSVDLQLEQAQDGFACFDGDGDGLVELWVAGQGLLMWEEDGAGGFVGPVVPLPHNGGDDLVISEQAVTTMGPLGVLPVDLTDGLHADVLVGWGTQSGSVVTAYTWVDGQRVFVPELSLVLDYVPYVIERIAGTSILDLRGRVDAFQPDAPSGLERLVAVSPGEPAWAVAPRAPEAFDPVEGDTTRFPFLLAGGDVSYNNLQAMGSTAVTLYDPSDGDFGFGDLVATAGYWIRPGPAEEPVAAVPHVRYAGWDGAVVEEPWVEVSDPAASPARWSVFERYQWSLAGPHLRPGASASQSYVRFWGIDSTLLVGREGPRLMTWSATGHDAGTAISVDPETGIGNLVTDGRECDGVAPTLPDCPWATTGVVLVAEASPGRGDLQDLTASIPALADATDSFVAVGRGVDEDGSLLITGGLGFLRSTDLDQASGATVTRLGGLEGYEQVGVRTRADQHHRDLTLRLLGPDGELAVSLAHAANGPLVFDAKPMHIAVAEGVSVDSMCVDDAATGAVTCLPWSDVAGSAALFEPVDVQRTDRTEPGNDLHLQGDTVVLELSVGAPCPACTLTATLAGPVLLPGAVIEVVPEVTRTAVTVTMDRVALEAELAAVFPQAGATAFSGELESRLGRRLAGRIGLELAIPALGYARRIGFIVTAE